MPVLLARMAEDQPLLEIDAREVYGSEVADLLRDDRCDLALAPLTSYPPGIRQQTVRREVVRLAVGAGHRLHGTTEVELGELREERFELWPRDMSPGYYDAIVGACRAAGFQPDIDEHGAGSTVWGYIAQSRGVGLVVSSLIEQLPRGVELIDLAPPRPILTVNAVWREDSDVPAIARVIETARTLARERRWD